MRKLKVAVYLNGIAPYDEALFRGISSNGIEVHLLIGGKFTNRPFWPEGKNTSEKFYKKVFLDSKRVKIGNYSENISLELFPILQKERYDAVIVPFGTITGFFIFLIVKFLSSFTISWCGVHKFHLTPQRIIGEPLIRLYVLLSSHFIAYSRYSKHYLTRLGVNPTKITVLKPNGVNITDFNPDNNPGGLRKKIMIDVDSKIVLFVGRLEKEKGVKYLIQAMNFIRNRRKNVYLLIVGSGSQYLYLKKLVKELQLENNVIFTGPIPNNKINKYYSICDVHVAPSIVTKYFVEPYGLVYQEAMASGKPSIAFNIPAPLRDIIDSGSTGYLVSEKNVEELAERIIELLFDDEKRVKMGIKARKKAVENYDINKISRDWAIALKYLLNG